jgi:hypothetical protein
MTISIIGLHEYLHKMYKYKKTRHNVTDNEITAVTINIFGTKTVSRNNIL